LAWRWGGQKDAPATLSPEDWRIVHALHSPRRFDELRELARVPSYQLLALIHFLREVGAVELRNADAKTGIAPAASSPAIAARLLGVSPDADRGAIRQAYHRLARRLHPDLHPRASAELRRNLEQRLAEVNRAYRELSRARLP
jgi:hypothetical protein